MRLRLLLVRATDSGNRIVIGNWLLPSVDALVGAELLLAPPARLSLQGTARQIASTQLHLSNLPGLGSMSLGALRSDVSPLELAAGEYRLEWKDEGGAVRTVVLVLSAGEVREVVLE